MLCQLPLPDAAATATATGTDRRPVTSQWRRAVTPWSAPAVRSGAPVVLTRRRHGGGCGRAEPLQGQVSGDPEAAGAARGGAGFEAGVGKAPAAGRASIRVWGDEEDCVQTGPRGRGGCSNITR